MAEHFINLNCANCGAKLDVYDDMDRFVCSYCGTEMIVQRRGGTVALKAVTEAIKKVQIGTDKTAAELALARLLQDRSELVAQFKNQAMPWGCAVPFSVVIVGLGIWVWIGTGVWFIGFCIVWAGVMLLGMNASGRTAKANFDSKIASLDQEIARQMEILSGK